MSEPDVELDLRFSDPDTSPTSWAQTVQVIDDAQLFWISTTRADGRPHVSPVVAVWVDDALHFSTGPTEQKALNIQTKPDVVLTTGANAWDDGLDVVVEGASRRIVGRANLERLAAAWARKWDGRWQLDLKGRSDAGSSRTPFRHARRTHTIWQYISFTALLRQDGDEGLPPPFELSATHGARGSRSIELTYEPPADSRVSRATSSASRE